MTPLARNRFDRRYDDLVELARSMLPRLAPGWTDWNAHDPGITLIELLAATTEAELYALSRSRRDERLAYAALFGVAPHGSRPARGVLWRDPADPASPAATYRRSSVIRADTAVRVEGQARPLFHPERDALFVPGRIASLVWRDPGGAPRDLTHANECGTEFAPFGERAGPRDVLALEFATPDGLLPSEGAAGAAWHLGVRAVHGGGEPNAESPTVLSVDLLAGSRRLPLKVLGDTSAGLLRTGVIALDVTSVTFLTSRTESLSRFTLELRAPDGFARPPRLLRIEPNVLPIVQRETVGEHFEAPQVPDFTFELERTGVCFEAGKEPLRITAEEGGEILEWRRCERLAEQPPDARVFEFDFARRRVRFGNGVNGQRPAARTSFDVSYSVSEGEAGNLARNRRWVVDGFTPPFGRNPDPLTGGASGSDSLELRREARRRYQRDHALVSAADLESAALALPLLEVARAWVSVPRAGAPRTGRVTLVAMRTRAGSEETPPAPESTRWLAAVRRRLAGRVPLGTRLVVVGPRYTVFAFRAVLEAATSRDPKSVEEAVKGELRKRLALVRTAESPKPRDPGVPLTRADVAAWLLAVPGVARIESLELRAGRGVADPVPVRRDGFPRLDFEASQLQVIRPAPGGRS